ncbi:uncharacterized protein LOC133296387 [Gastrolobium bilobum]|uniref:uncharacterized protein LOC133296387 n=1 Tax=Gastrolobium bilobum TaxID=150636 RepID=UPI002AAF0EE3|nr:uncharacterized protein LOC133296387 [Gastrolobium bilobum]
MQRRLEGLWAREGRIRVTNLENDYFLVRFEKNEDLEFAWSEGPWSILNHYIAVRSWSPNFQPHMANIDKIAAWVRLPDIPVEYFASNVFGAIGNWLGKFIKIDNTTTSIERGHFARLCVELDLSQPLHGEYKLEGQVKKVEYEGLHLVCFECGTYGHRTDSCPVLRARKMLASTTLNNQGDQQNTDGTVTAVNDESPDVEMSRENKEIPKEGYGP